MEFIVSLKVTKNHGFTLSLENTLLEKPQRSQIDAQAFPGLKKLLPLTAKKNKMKYQKNILSSLKLRLLLSQCNPRN